MTKLLICGSAAAEAVPGIFCTCPLCLKALNEGGKDVRSRTAYQLGEQIRIDLGPDLFYHMVKYRLRFDKLRDLVITHNHRDHFAPDDLGNRRKGMSKLPEGSVLRVIGAPVVTDQLKNTPELAKCGLEYAPVEHGSKVMLSGDVELTAFRANHGAPDSLFYAFRTKEYSLLIANDTGWFPDESWDLLKTFSFDAVVLDCCYMHWDQRNGHLGGDSFIGCFEELRKQGSLKENALLVANHFSHNPNLSHQELCDWLNPRGIEVGFDGMEIEL